MAPSTVFFSCALLLVSCFSVEFLGQKKAESRTVDISAAQKTPLKAAVSSSSIPKAVGMHDTGGEDLEGWEFEATDDNWEVGDSVEPEAGRTQVLEQQVTRLEGENARLKRALEATKYLEAGHEDEHHDDEDGLKGIDKDTDKGIYWISDKDTTHRRPSKFYNPLPQAEGEVTEPAKESGCYCNESNGDVEGGFWCRRKCRCDMKTYGFVKAGPFCPGAESW